MGAILHLSGFFATALLAALLAGISAGLTGTYGVTKKMGTLSGGLAHSVMGGIGLAYFLEWEPMLGAAAAALLFVSILSFGKIRMRQNMDTMVASLWSAGMALGIVFMYLKPGYNVDLISYLFGNILMVTGRGVILLAVLDLFLLLFVFLFYKPLQYVSFDEEYAEMRGIKTEYAFFMLMAMVALTVIMLTRIVGLVLVIAMLTLPAASASLFSKSIGRMMLLSVLFAVSYNVIGLSVSYGVDLPSGAVIILCAITGYGIMYGVKAILTVKKQIPTE